MRPFWLFLSFALLCLVTQRVHAEYAFPLFEKAEGFLKESIPALKANLDLARDEIKYLNKPKDSTLLEQRKKETHFYIPRELTERDTFRNFIAWKLKSESQTEQEYYRQFAGLTDKDVEAFIASLISKRTRVFMNKQDLTLLRKEHSNNIMWLPWHYIGDDTWENPKGKTRQQLWAEWAAKWQVYKDDKQGDSGGYKWPLHHVRYQMDTLFESFPFQHFGIKNYLSYDEMQLAALLIVAGPTTFHSNCGLKYKDQFIGRKYHESEHVKEGYIVGVVGARFELAGVMDFSLLVPSNRDKDKKLREIIYGEEYKDGVTAPKLMSEADRQRVWMQFDWWNQHLSRWTTKRDAGFLNVAEVGDKEETLTAEAKALWANLWLEEAKSKKVMQAWNAAIQANEVVPIGSSTIRVSVHRKLYKERLKMTYGAYFDFVLQTMSKLNAGKEKKDHKKAYVIVLPIGGGVWAIDAVEQTKYAWPVIQSLLEQKRYASAIDTVHLTGPPKTWDAFKDDADQIKQLFVEQGIVNEIGTKLNGIVVTNAPLSGPAAKTAKDASTVRFFAYPWDSNALPGNEFWYPEADNWPGVSIDVDGKKTANDPVAALVANGNPGGLWQMSGDPAAACCSDIIYTQNWRQNTQLQEPYDVQFLGIRPGDFVCTDDMKMGWVVSVEPRTSKLSVKFHRDNDKDPLILYPELDFGAFKCPACVAVPSYERRIQEVCLTSHWEPGQIACAAGKRIRLVELEEANFGPEYYDQVQWRVINLLSGEVQSIKQMELKECQQKKQARRLAEEEEEHAQEMEGLQSRDLLASGLRSYSFYSVILVTVVLATAMFIVSFFWRVV